VKVAPAEETAAKKDTDKAETKKSAAAKRSK
jgi:hypothetical protein